MARKWSVPCDHQESKCEPCCRDNPCPYRQGVAPLSGMRQIPSPKHKLDLLSIPPRRGHWWSTEGFHYGQRHRLLLGQIPRLLRSLKGKRPPSERGVWLGILLLPLTDDLLVDSAVVQDSAAEVPARVQTWHLPSTRRCLPREPAVLHQFLRSTVPEMTPESRGNCTISVKQRQ